MSQLTFGICSFIADFIDFTNLNLPDNQKIGLEIVCSTPCVFGLERASSYVIRGLIKEKSLSNDHWKILRVSSRRNCCFHIRCISRNRYSPFTLREKVLRVRKRSLCAIYSSDATLYYTIKHIPNRFLTENINRFF